MGNEHSHIDESGMERRTFVDHALLVVCTNMFFSVRQPITEKAEGGGTTAPSTSNISNHDKSGSKSKSDIRKDNEQLWSDHDSLVQEQKKLRQIIERLQNEYEESKNFEIFRRYGKLKGMIKRAVLHIKLGSGGDEPTLGTGLMAMCGTFGRQKVEQTRRRGSERYADMSAQDLNNENNDLMEQIRESRRKNQMVKDMIEQMDRSYEDSKRYMVFQRYRLMKDIVKHLTRNKIW